MRVRAALDFPNISFDKLDHRNAARFSNSAQSNCFAIYYLCKHFIIHLAEGKKS